MARKNLYPPSVTPGIPNYNFKPEGWIETTFGNVLQVIQRKVDMKDEAEYQLVTAKRSRGGIVPRDILQGKDILTKTQFYTKADDFLISRRQIIHGACGVVPPELDGAVVSNEYNTLRVKDGLLLDFLNYFAHTVFFQQTCFQSSVGVDVEKMIFNLNEWLRYKVYLPPLFEQRKIAGILGTWDEAITRTEQLIHAHQCRKKALMQQLLTGKVRFGEFGGEWREVQIKDLARKVTDGTHKTPHYVETGIPFISTNNLVPFSEEFDFSRYSRFISFNEHQELIRRCKPERGDLLVSKCGTIGRTQLIRANLEFSIFVGLALVKVNKDKIVPEFLEQLLNHDYYKHKMEVAAPGGTRATLTIKGLQQVSIFVPPTLEEQRRIAAVLQTFDVEIDLLQQKFAALRRQKKGLMQQLLTGRVRV